MTTSEASDHVAHNGPGRPRDEQAHEAILAATRALIAELGYRHVSIEGIARRAGVGKSTIYRWWRSKGLLVFEAVWKAAPRRAMPDTGNLEQDLRGLMGLARENWNDLVVRKGFPGMLADLTGDRALFATVDQKFLDPDRAAKAQVFERAVERGDVADVSSDFLWDVITGYLLMRLMQSGGPITEEQGEQLVQLILRGITGESC